MKPGHDQEGRPQGRLFHFLDLLMGGHATDEQRARVEDINARLRLRPGEAMNEIIAVYEMYLAELARELADVSRQVRRGMAMSCVVTLLTCFIVILPLLFFRGTADSARQAAVASRPDACEAGGEAFCDGVAAMATDRAKVHLAGIIARMPPDEAQSLAQSQPGVSAFTYLGRLNEQDRKRVSDFAATRMGSSP